MAPTAPVVATAPTIASTQIQDGSGEASSVSTFSVTFANAVKLGAGQAFKFYSENINSDGSVDTNTADATDVSSGISASLSSDGKTLTFTVIGGGSLDRTGGGLGDGTTGYLVDGIYQLVLNGSQITDAATGTAALDSGSSMIVQFNSNEAGGESNYFHALFGDVDGDGFVSNSDYRSFTKAYGSSSGDSNYNEYFDYDGSGFIGNSIYRAFKANFGKSYSY
jgi:hypothetical protein